jgi:lytic murein transglycosylase
MIRIGDDPCVANDRSKHLLRLDVASVFQRFLCLAFTVILLAGFVAEARADTSCRGGESFESWLGKFRREAAREGVSARALAALDGIAHDDRVLRQDRGQPTLSQSFLEFVGRVVSADRLQRGRAMLDRHADTFARIERDYGVPGPVIVALWGLETDYGAYRGDFSSLSALATLAYDCRRPEHFRAELLDALKIVDRGDMAPSAMKGAWAGELGQVQFTPSNYLRFAVDYDGDGRRDLVSSVPDVLASTANYLRHLGWRRDEPWLEEVRAADTVPWQESARAIRQPRSFWAAVGVTRTDGSALRSDRVPASLLLPMGRLGPAFLAYENFGIFWEWNQSSNYTLAVAYFATRLGGAPPMNKGTAPAILGSAEMRELQERLNARGFDAGEPDGRLGEVTRTGVKKAQLAFDLPADGYPTRELLQRLRGR